MALLHRCYVLFQKWQERAGHTGGACGDRAKVSYVSEVLRKTVGLNDIEKICSISILRVPYNQNSLSRYSRKRYIGVIKTPQ